jgi:hypothetical protein
LQIENRKLTARVKALERGEQPPSLLASLGFGPFYYRRKSSAKG